MKHLATIQAEFLKAAAKWDDLSYEAQKEYLQQHRKSKKKMTAKPGQSGADMSELKDEISKKRESLTSEKIDKVKLPKAFTNQTFMDSIYEMTKSEWKDQDEDEDASPEKISKMLVGNEENLITTLEGADSYDNTNTAEVYKSLTKEQKKALQEKLKKEIESIVKDKDKEYDDDDDDDDDDD